MAWDHLPKPAKGAGRGGPAKGAGSGPAKPFTADSHDPAVLEREHALNGDSDEQAYRAEQRKLNRELRKEAWAALRELVRNKKHPSRFNAARETLNRIDGMPVQKNEHTGADGEAIVTEVIYRWAEPEKS
jgi:hypothetical protein